MKRQLTGTQGSRRSQTGQPPSVISRTGSAAQRCRAAVLTQIAIPAYGQRDGPDCGRGSDRHPVRGLRRYGHAPRTALGATRRTLCRVNGFRAIRHRCCVGTTKAGLRCGRCRSARAPLLLHRGGDTTDRGGIRRGRTGRSFAGNWRNTRHMGTGVRDLREAPSRCQCRRSPSALCRLLTTAPISTRSAALALHGTWPCRGGRPGAGRRESALPHTDGPARTYGQNARAPGRRRPLPPRARRLEP
ncbi:hypothetical protein SAMN05428944_8046 [Streptomyces sp. 1222.5]|nr:hypothetical protein BX260_8056 [Streptomyces sp. 5112.2]SED86785.1 hypothetical protein SAMN05428944_8046 [Streptomyces sp. 1222.5]